MEQEYKYGIKFVTLESLNNWLMEAIKILDSEFPGWVHANQVEIYNGRYIFISTNAIAFRFADDATQFILKYQKIFPVILTTDLRFDIIPYYEKKHSGNSGVLFNKNH